MARDSVHQAKVSCHVITSGRNGELLVKEIYLTESVENIYVFCGDKEYHPSWAKNYGKVSCIEDQIETILFQIKENLIKWSQKGSSLKSDLPAMSLLSSDRERSEMNHLHLRLKIIPMFENREQAKEDFLALSKGIYDQKSRKHLEDFEKNFHEYNLGQIFRWYSMESFLYKVTNNCLRISTSDSLQYARLIIRDMEKAIEEQYQAKSKSFNGRLYRGAPFSENEWFNLKQNRGQEIEMRGFLSVSKARNIAEKYVYASSRPLSFITIIVPKGEKEEEQGFAEIEDYSRFPHEKEILFNVRSRFTILETEDKYSENLPRHHLVLLYGAQGFRKFIAERNPVQEVLIPSIEDFSCAHCKAQAHETPETFFFMSLKGPQGQYYSCKKCLDEESSKSAGPFLCISISDKAGSKKINGCLLENSDKAEIPFFGYECNKCLARKQKMYFTCTDCAEKWCQNCFETMNKCMEAGHSIIVETTPFSFWCERMSQNELNHLKFHDNIVESYGKIFQQPKMYVECHESPQAIEYYNTYIEEKEAKGKDDDLATAYNNLGSIFKSQGEYIKAIRYFLKSLDMRKSLCGDTHPVVATSYDDIGNVYSRQGEEKKALEYYLRSFDIRKAVYGDNHLEIATSYQNIGNAYYNQGEVKKAHGYYLECLNIRKSVHGDSHPDIATSYNSIGMIYYSQGEHNKAFEYYLECLNVRKSVYGDSHPDVATSYQNLGSAYSKQRDYGKALEYYLKSLEILSSIYGDCHPEVANSYENIGNVHLDQRKYQIALEYFLKCLNTRKSVHGDNHSQVALSYQNLGHGCYFLGEHNKAIEFYSKCLEIRKSVYGESHPDVAASYKNIGTIYSSQGENKEALQFYFRSLEVKQSVYGDNHPDIATSYHDIGLVYANRGEHSKTLEYYLKSLNLRKSIYGNHLLVATK